MQPQNTILVVNYIENFRQETTIMEQKEIERWALEILQPKFPNRQIVELKVNTGPLAGDNFTCQVYSISVMLSETNITTDVNNTCASKLKDLGENSNFNHHFVIKCFPDNLDRCEFIAKTQIFEKELLVYGELIPELIKFQENFINNEGQKLKHIINPFPKSFGGNYRPFDPRNETREKFLLSVQNNYVIMEDIRLGENFLTINNPRDCLEYNHCKIALVELAKVHALSLVYRKTVLPGKFLNEKFRCLKETLITNETKFLRSKILESCASVGINILETHFSMNSAYIQKIKAFKGKIMQIMAHFLSGDAYILSFSEMLHTEPNLDDLQSQNKDLKLSEEWYIFCHGDFWASNILFKYSEESPVEPISAKFVDFQLVRENCLTTDLIFLFYMSTTSDFRKKHMKQLLEIYFNSFVEVCNTFNVLPWKNFSFENLLVKVAKAKIWGVALALLALPIIYSGADKNEDLDQEQEGLNSVFEGVGRGSNDMAKMLASRLLEIAVEVADEGII